LAENIREMDPRWVSGVHATAGGWVDVLPSLEAVFYPQMGNDGNAPFKCFEGLLAFHTVDCIISGESLKEAGGTQIVGMISLHSRDEYFSLASYLLGGDIDTHDSKESLHVFPSIAGVARDGNTL
jgi:hypothetical protein